MEKASSPKSAGCWGMPCCPPTQSVCPWVTLACAQSWNEEALSLIHPPVGPKACGPSCKLQPSARSDVDKQSHVPLWGAGTNSPAPHLPAQRWAAREWSSLLRGSSGAVDALKYPLGLRHTPSLSPDTTTNSCCRFSEHSITRKQRALWLTAVSLRAVTSARSLSSP